MTNLDHAFINAYAEHSPADSHGSSFSRRAEAPELRIFAHAVQRGSQETRADHADPLGMAAPHFTQPHASVHTLADELHEAAVQDDEIILPSLVTERKPLSSFAKPRQEPDTNFKPVFEVDEFQWPAVTNELIGNARNPLLSAVDALTRATHDGRSLVGIVGTDRGVGASTVAMCLARMVAAAGSTVALVDANFVAGDLAVNMGLEFDAGWEDVLTGRRPLAECAVYSLADRITLLPLAGPTQTEIQRLSGIQSSVIAGMLRYHYDLVLFDLGPASQLGVIREILEHCRLDVVAIVAPSGARDVGTLHAIEQVTSLFGPRCLGVIGNRAS